MSLLCSQFNRRRVMDSDDEDDDWYVGVMSRLGFLYSWYFWYPGLLTRTWQWLTDQLPCPNHNHSQRILICDDTGTLLLFFIFSLADYLPSTHCSKAATYLETFLWIQRTILISSYCNNWNLPHIFDCVDFFWGNLCATVYIIKALNKNFKKYLLHQFHCL